MQHSDPDTQARVEAFEAERSLAEHRALSRLAGRIRTELAPLLEDVTAREIAELIRHPVNQYRIDVSKT